MCGQQQSSHTTNETLRLQGATGEDGHSHLADRTFSVAAMETKKKKEEEEEEEEEAEEDLEI